MTSAQRDRVKELLVAMLEHPLELRAEILRDACGGDDVVRIEVERLLSVRDELGAFLVTPAIRGPGRLVLGEAVGATLNNRYVLEAYVGSGGFAEVYQARDIILGDRQVAVKILHRGVLGASSLAREINALASIDHPGVVGVLDVGAVGDGRRFLVMRYLKGPTLREMLSAKVRLSDAKLRTLALQLVEALDAAHRQAVLHLDLKPENIVIRDPGTPAERAVILDFGVGVLTSGTQEYTPLSTSKAVYRAPESYTCEASPRSDYYSLGAVLFELLTGRYLEEQRILESVPMAWRSVLRRLLARNPADRLGSSSEISTAIRRTARWASAARTVAAAGIIVVVMFAVTRREAANPVFPVPVPFTSLLGEETQPAFSPDGDRVFFAWRRETGESNIYVMEAGASKPTQLTSYPKKETHPACSRDGRWLAFLRDQGSGNNSLMVMPSTGGTETEYGVGPYNSITWAPDGRAIAVAFAESPGTPMKIHLFDLQRRAWRLLTTPLDGIEGDLHPAFSPDGRSLAFVRNDQNNASVYILSVDQGLNPVGAPRQLTHGNPDVITPQWSPDGKTVLYAAGMAGNRGLWFVPADGSAPPRRIFEAGDRLDELAVASSRWRMVFARSQTDLNIWRLDLQNPGGPVVEKRVFLSSSRREEEAQISPDGRTIAFLSDRSGDEQVWVADINAAHEKQLTSFSEAASIHLFWAPDSTALLVTGTFKRRIHSFLVSYPAGTISEIGQGLYETVSGWSKDGNWLYIPRERSGRIRLWKVPVQGGEGVPVTGSPGLIASESFDRKTLYFCTRHSTDGVWAVPVSGGHEKKVISSLARRAFAVGREGIYHLSGDGPPSIWYFRFADGSHKVLHTLEKRPGFGFDVSPDERLILFTQLDHDGEDLMLIDNFRI